MRQTSRALCAAVFAWFLGAGAARAEKSLHWRSVDVKARLDATGVLHVVERQAMVFTGDWNGGERKFRLFPGQTLSFESLRRVDPSTGETREIERGDLSQVDRYGFTDATTLRWRSRLPSDPEFSNTEIVYEIAYRLSGVLVKQGDTYVLEPEFAFPDRGGAIDSFSLALDFDPAWAPPLNFESRRKAGPLHSGQGYVVRVELGFHGVSAPSAARTGTSRSMRLWKLILILAGLGLFGAAFIARESALGRFAPLPEPESIDEGWLAKNLLSLLPEEAGALWDDKIGPPEVAAVLARLQGEGKIETQTSGKEMTMHLKAPLEDFKGYEKDLLAALFFGKRQSTSTSEIRSHYKSKGFDPAATIKPGLTRKLEGHADFQDRSGRPARWPTALLFFGGIALLGLALLRDHTDFGTVVSIAISFGFFWAVALIPAAFYQRRMDRLGPWAISLLVVPALFLWSAVTSLQGGGTVPAELVFGQLLLQLALFSNLFNLAKTREGPHKIARRKQLVAARRFFDRELGKHDPHLKDAWFPWIVAFGMGPSVDRWFHSFGGAARAGATTGSSTSSSSSSSGGVLGLLGVDGRGRILGRRRVFGRLGGRRGRAGRGCFGAELERRRRRRRRRGWRELGRRRRGRLVTKRRGALSRLYSEFTDPSASGDTLNMLRRYAEGLVPGCMGLLFMGVGILVIVLFSRQIVSSDKKTYLPLLFGAWSSLSSVSGSPGWASRPFSRRRAADSADEDGDASKK